MGIYDRDYYQEERRSWLDGGASTMVVNLIIINIAIYVAQVLFQRSGLTDFLALQSDIWRRPWELWKFVTYGFAHSPRDVFHVLFNMYALWLFGRELESTSGKKDFLTFYLSTIVLAGIGWVAAHNIIYPDSPSVPLVGASGGVMGVAVVYAMRYPHQKIYLLFLPVPVWLLIGVLVLKDFVSFQNAAQSGMFSPVAVEAHLTGAFAGFLYQKYQWSLGSLWPGALSRGWRNPFRSRPKLRVHREPPVASPREDLESQVDLLLDKIRLHGEGSLTAAERATLEEASRRYRRRAGK